MISRVKCWLFGHEWIIAKYVECKFAIPVECNKCGKFKFTLNRDEVKVT